MPIAAPVAGALVGGATSLIQNAFNSYAVRKQNEQNQRNWREQNEYNTPKAQRKRMEDAGLNPALMYGQGSTGNAQAAQNTERHGIDITQIGTIINTFLDLKKKDADIENTRENTRATKYDANMKGMLEGFYEAQQDAQTNILKDKEKESEFNIGRGTLPKDSPMFQKYEAEIQKMLQEFQIGTLQKSSKSMENKRDKWDFERDLEDKEKYDINPRDPDNVRVMKKILKQMFNKKPEDLLDILGTLFRK